MRELATLTLVMVLGCSTDDSSPSHLTTDSGSGGKKPGLDAGTGGSGGGGGAGGTGGTVTGGAAGSGAAPSDAGDEPIVTIDSSKTCGKPVCFAWPLPGSDAHEWVINNYVDLDPASGTLRDYMGNTGSAAKTYDNHHGIDIDVPNFRAMDSDFPVNAAAPGQVTAIHDSEFDRNTSCASNDANYVFVKHSDGSVAWYLHLKKDSVVVNVGDSVNTGQKLGVVGSSGCSTAPHLHFELHDASDNVIEPFEAGVWLDPPVYDTPIGFMDGVLKNGSISGVDELKDPAPNVTTLGAGQPLGVGLSIGGGASGDSVSVRYVKPDGTSTSSVLTFSETYRHSFWYFSPNMLSTKGAWTIEMLVNSTVAKSYPITVN